MPVSSPTRHCRGLEMSKKLKAMSSLVERQRVMEFNKKLYGLFAAVLVYSTWIHIVFLGKEYPAGLVPYGWMGVYSLTIWSQVSLMIYAICAGPNGFRNKLQKIYAPNFLNKASTSGIGDSIHHFFGAIAYGAIVAIPAFVFISGPILLLTVGIPAYILIEINFFLSLPILAAYITGLTCVTLTTKNYLYSELSINQILNSALIRLKNLTLSDRAENSKKKVFKNWNLKSSQEIYNDFASYARPLALSYDLKTEVEKNGFDHAFLSLLITGSRIEFDQILRENRSYFCDPNSDKSNNSGLVDRLATSLTMYSLRLSCLQTVVKGFSTKAEELLEVLDQEEEIHQTTLSELNPSIAKETQNLLTQISSKIVDNQKSMNEWSQLALIIIKTIEEGGIHQTSNLARNYILRTKCVVFDAITGADQFDENPEDLYCLHQILGFDISPDDLDSLDIQ